MGLMQAMKGANNAWGTIICSDGVGTIGPENFLKNTDHKLMITIGTNTFVFSKNDVQSIKIITSTSEWIKYLITLKNGKKYLAIFMAVAVSENAGNAKLSASQTGKKINTAIKNFEWWMFDLIYSNQNVASMGNTVYNANTPVSQVNNYSSTTNSQPITNQSDYVENVVVSKPTTQVRTTTQTTRKTVLATPTTTKKPDYWICKKCKTKNLSSRIFCSGCGEYK